LLKKTGAIDKKVGSDFPGETFRVLKEKEEKKYGEYRTRRLILKYVSEGGIRGIRAIDVI
jgi:hypothetical protein